MRPTGSRSWYSEPGLSTAATTLRRKIPLRPGPEAFVKRAARTPHCDGVPANQPDPAVIAVFGEGPVNQKLIDPAQPSWRQV